MHMKKIAALLAVSALLIVPASAHGGHCRQAAIQQQPAVYYLCQVEGCTVAGRHYHDGTAYCGAEHACGWCDGTCQTRPLCTAEGCTQAGYHTHNGEAYCGAEHACGWCDGSCQTAVTAQASGQAAVTVQASGHHGGGNHHGRCR